MYSNYWITVIVTSVCGGVGVGGDYPLTFDLLEKEELEVACMIKSTMMDRGVAMAEFKQWDFDNEQLNRDFGYEMHPTP